MAANPGQNALMPQPWDPNNPIGTSELRQAYMTSADGKPFDPVVGAWPTGVPMTQSQYDSIKNGSISLFNALSMAGPVPRAPELPLPRQIPGAFSARVGYTPPVKPQRPLTADYPNGVQTDANGRILFDIEGRRLTAPTVVGRSTLGDSGTAADRGMDPAAIKGLGADAGGAQFLEVAPGAIGRKAVGSFTPDYDPATGLRSAQIRYSNALMPAQQDNVAAHEVGHLLEWASGGDFPQAGLSKELRGNYNTLATGQERARHLMGPEQYDYKAGQIPKELTAEAFRAYMQDPNYFKTVAPKTAAAIRAFVNSNPRLAPFIQFNSLAGGMMGGAAVSPWMQGNNLLPQQDNAP